MKLQAPLNTLRVSGPSPLGQLPRTQCPHTSEGLLDGNKVRPRGLQGQTTCHVKAGQFPPPGNGTVSDGSQVGHVHGQLQPPKSWTFPNQWFVELRCWVNANGTGQSQGGHTWYQDKEPWVLELQAVWGYYVSLPIARCKWGLKEGQDPSEGTQALLSVPRQPACKEGQAQATDLKTALNICLCLRHNGPQNRTENRHRVRPARGPDPSQEVASSQRDPSSRSPWTPSLPVEVREYRVGARWCLVLAGALPPQAPG